MLNQTETSRKYYCTRYLNIGNLCCRISKTVLKLNTRTNYLTLDISFNDKLIDRWSKSPNLFVLLLCPFLSFILLCSNYYFFFRYSYSVCYCYRLVKTFQIILSFFDLDCILMFIAANVNASIYLVHVDPNTIFVGDLVNPLIS